MCGLYVVCVFCFFFFQAEDGIRDDLVTGVQTCALPISSADLADRRRRGLEFSSAERDLRERSTTRPVAAGLEPARYGWNGVADANPRSEERRVGKECRSRWSPYH